MHELAVTRLVLSTVLDRLRENGLSKVVAVSLTVGELRGFEQEWVQRYFSAAAKGTPAADAVVTLFRVPSRFRCRDCHQDFRIDLRGDAAQRCPHCRGRDYALCAGDELQLSGMQAI